MVRVPGILMVALLCRATPSQAATRQPIWAADHPVSLQARLPVRVQKATAQVVRIFSEDGGQVATMAVHSEGPAVASVRPLIAGETNVPPSRSAQEFRFSRDGSLVVFSPKSEGGGGTYLQAFDVTSKEFSTDVYTLERTRALVLGASRAARFVASEERQIDRMVPPGQLRLDLITHDTLGFHATSKWETASYTTFVSADMNDHGDLVALLANCTGGSIEFACSGFKLVLLKADGGIVEQEITGVTRGAVIGISANGSWIALSNRTCIRIYDAGKLTDSPASVDMAKCASCTHVGSIMKLAVGNDRRVAAVSIAEGHWQTIYARPVGACGMMDAYDFEKIADIDVRFFDRSIYIATTALKLQDATATALLCE